MHRIALYNLIQLQAELGPSRNSTLKRVDEVGEPDTGSELEEKFTAEERINEKGTFVPQNYIHQSGR